VIKYAASQNKHLKYKVRTSGYLHSHIFVISCVRIVRTLRHRRSKFYRLLGWTRNACLLVAWTFNSLCARLSAVHPKYRGSIPSRRRRFVGSTKGPDRLRDPLSLLLNRYRDLFSECKEDGVRRSSLASIECLGWKWVKLCFHPLSHTLPWPTQGQKYLTVVRR